MRTQPSKRGSPWARRCSFRDGAFLRAFDEPPRDDAIWVDPDQGRRPAGGLGPPSDFDATWLPRRQDVVDDDRGAARPLDVAGLLCPAVAAPADVDRVEFGVVAEADG